METHRGDGILGFHSYFHIWQNSDNGRVVSYMPHPHLTPNEISWYSVLLEAEWIPGLQKDPTDNRTRNLPSCCIVT
jgi:aminopeptidase-like protein